jgi:transmembrane sensor
MSRWDDFQASLQQTGRAIDAIKMPESTNRRVWARLQHDRSGRSVASRKLMVLSLGLAALVAIVAIRYGAHQPRHLGDWLVAEASSDLAAGAIDESSVQISSGRCVLRDDSWGGSVALDGPARLRREGRAVRLVSGRIQVRIDKRATGHAPAEVLVSGGVIQVMGTRFTVTQNSNDGRVTLHEGSIRFVRTTGSSVLLAPGQSLAWPVAPAPAAAVPPPPPPAVAPATVKEATGMARAVRPSGNHRTQVANPSIDALLTHIAELRSRGQYRQAAEELLRDLPPGRSAGAETASFELGSILTDHLADRTRGCAHWRRHLERFPTGNFAADARREQVKLGCGGEATPGVRP